MGAHGRPFRIGSFEHYYIPRPTQSLRPIDLEECPRLGAPLLDDEQIRFEWMKTLASPDIRRITLLNLYEKRRIEKN